MVVEQCPGSGRRGSRTYDDVLQCHTCGHVFWGVFLYGAHTPRHDRKVTVLDVDGAA